MNLLFGRLWKDESGQTATEYMLLISVVVVAVVAAAYLFIPTFSSGVYQLGKEVSTILECGKINKAGGCHSGT